MGVPGRFLVLLLLGTAGALQFAAGSSADGPTIESAGPGSNGYFWSPSTAAVGAGGTVAFRSTSTTVPHGVRWTGGPEKPSCSGVPVEQEKTNWSGQCTFAQAGTYSFVCTVHPTEMKGTITVASGEAPPPPPESPEGPLATGLKLARRQKGAVVRGSIDLQAAGARLEVGLQVARSLLSGPGRSGTTRVGRMSLVSGGSEEVAFRVPLKPAARRALAGRGALPLTVAIDVSGPAGQSFERTRRVVMLSGGSG